MPAPCRRLEAFPNWRARSLAAMAPRPISWVNTPVLLQAIERYERGQLPRSMQLWLQAVLELDAPVNRPLRPHC